MEMHSLTSSSFTICSWGEAFGSRIILFSFFLFVVVVVVVVSEKHDKNTCARSTVHESQEDYAKTVEEEF